MYFDIDEFAEDCKRHYNAPNESSVALKVIIYGGLYYMFSGHPLIIEHSLDKTDPSGVPYRTYAETCRVRLQECLLEFPLLLEPTIENVAALATGVG